MALSATFTANFASFYDAVDKADTKLKDFGAGADKVGGRLTALGNSFSGVKIIQDATLMVKAVEDIGGASKLTEKELARLGATTNEAVAKMKALGMEVPQNLQEIADKTKGATKATTDWMGSLTKVAGAVGIAFSVDAIVNFVGSVFDAASAIKDLSDQWGVSTTIVQQWTGAAKQSGVEAETVGKSVQFLTEQLGDGSDQYVALLKNVGLSYDKLRQMPLADAYKAVITAIAGIKDETLQLDVAQGLLGVSSKKMVGAIRDGFLEAADAQKVMSEETIKRLEAAQAAWERFKNAVVIDTGEMLAAVGMTTESMTRSWGNFFSIVGHGIVGTFLPATNKSGAALVVMDQAMTDLGKSAKTTAPAIDHVTDAGTGLTKGIKTQAEVAEDLRKKTERLKQSEKDRADALVAAKKDQDAYTNALIAHDTAINDLMDTFAGRGVIQKANLYLEALKTSIPIEQMTAEQQANINKVMLDAIEVYDAAGQSAPQVLYDIWGATVKVEEVTDDFGKTLDDIMLKMGKIKGIDLNEIGWGGVVIRPGDMPKPPPLDTDGAKAFAKAIHDLSGAFAQLSQISEGVFADIAKDIAVLIGAMDTAHVSTEIFQKGVKDFNTGKTTQGIGQMAAGAVGVVTAFQSATKETDKLHSTLNGAAIGFSVAGPWGAAVGAGIGLIKGFFNEAKRSKELNNLRDDFIRASGGMTALSAAAREAGGNLDAVLRARSADQLKKAISDLTAAFQYQQDALQLAMDTAEKYGFTLEELGPALQRQELDKQAQQLFKDWEVLNGAGLDTVLITEKMSQSVSEYVQQALKMGLEVPAAMRPMLEAMVKSGTLLDENGNAITDLKDAGVVFALTMSEGFQRLIDEVEKLTLAITRGLHLAIKETPELNIPVRFTYPDGQSPIIKGPIFNPAPGSGGGGGQPGPGIESYQGGTDGFKNFGRGTPVILHGWEAVVPRDDAGAFATVHGAGGGTAAAAMAPSIVINAQGAFFDTPESLQRLASKVSDALTAKYSVMGKLRAAG